MTDNPIDQLIQPETALPLLNKPWEKPLQCLQATITGLDAAERNLRTAIDTMPPDMLLPGEIAVMEVEANQLRNLVASLLKWHMAMARNIRKQSQAEENNT